MGAPPWGYFQFQSAIRPKVFSSLGRQTGGAFWEQRRGAQGPWSSWEVHARHGVFFFVATGNIIEL